ncbi:hypothetical protein [Nocardioides caricicola]|uniref:Lipoprotein n=1 Tax=Nocardioides caricicola TaxID=634770 RepID=A0ABW0MVE6_9ACTN
MPIRPFLATALAVTVLAACGGQEAPTSEPTEPEASESHEAAPEPTTEPEPEIGAAFVEFVRGGDVPPMRDQVALFLGNALTGVVTPGLAADLPAWATCTEVGRYAGRTCPISPITVLKKHRRVEYAEAATSDCLKTFGPLPRSLREMERVVVVPAHGSGRGCGGDFAIQLFASDEGELVAVSTLLGVP